MNNYDFLVVGGGIFGITAAIELSKRHYKVGLINPDKLPHHLAASTDISKIVRMEYGSDQDYFQMAEASIAGWLEWNELLGEKLYHEVGFLMLCNHEIESGKQPYEESSFNNLMKAGYKLDLIDHKELTKRFPVFNGGQFRVANFNPKGGFVKSGYAIQHLVNYAKSLGVDIHEGQTAKELLIENGVIKGVKTIEGFKFNSEHTIVAAGAHTPSLIPELRPFMKSTGHPVFWIKPQEPRRFTPGELAVFTADIANTGWYGFPLDVENGVLKIGRHTNGEPIHPSRDDRRVTDEEVKDLRSFLKESIPLLLEAPLIYTRKCLYTDTLDGHYWIARHPEMRGLSVSTGGSGHGFKMGPVLGAISADIAEGKPNKLAEKFAWRHLSEKTKQSEEARYFNANEA